jgi:hypothetical protein
MHDRIRDVWNAWEKDRGRSDQRVRKTIRERERMER